MDEREEFNIEGINWRIYADTSYVDGQKIPNSNNIYSIVELGTFISVVAGTLFDTIKVKLQ